MQKCWQPFAWQHALVEYPRILGTKTYLQETLAESKMIFLKVTLQKIVFFVVISRSLKSFIWYPSILVTGCTAAELQGKGLQACEIFKSPIVLTSCMMLDCLKVLSDRSALQIHSSITWSGFGDTIPTVMTIINKLTITIDNRNLLMIKMQLCVCVFHSSVAAVMSAWMWGMVHTVCRLVHRQNIPITIIFVSCATATVTAAAVGRGTPLVTVHATHVPLDAM